MTGDRLWQPWSLRELVADTTAAAHTSRSRIEATESRVLAWVTRDVPAVEPPRSGPLAGVPFGVKDIIDVAGLPTRCGSPLRADAAPARDDASIVTAWRRTGAMPAGKTVSTEFAYFSPGQTRNPAAVGHTPGGSSSGSAAAVAAGHVPLALGSQTAGSVTRPASFCGVAALVLSHGRFPGTGVVGLSPSLDSHGFFAARVTDLALAWSALTGCPDPATTADVPPRLLIWRPRHVDPPMAAALNHSRDQLAGTGAQVDEFTDGHLVDRLTTAHPVIMAYEAARERAAELALAPRLSRELATLLRTGADTSRQDYDDARRVVADTHRPIAELFSRYDAIIGPAAPGPAPAGLAATGDPVLSRPWQALGLPVLTVPGLRTEQGLPLGLQLIGTSWREDALLTTGCWVEHALTR
ncbi:amidase [Amycolatopsis sp. YIM 10]|uniref:amidase family protein n=1 Tax=Amycolatopsis sp. YIM 10 TaxID=2653857 RepID=UPI0012A8BD22|nr:amidase [Amycolatopsis sp. YIM 10]QFU89798.1 Glutamyl-tRNA(Gln) amidotransferase subunit A [Amycolatopsis sp. YIM 10]